MALTEAEESWVQNWQRQRWKTNFEIKSVDLREIRQAAAACDVIPPLDEPKHVSLADGDEFLDDLEPVGVFEYAGLSCAYPLQILTWHEIVNGEVGGDPVLVTYWPFATPPLVSLASSKARHFGLA